MEQNNKKIIMDIVPKPALRDEKGDFGYNTKKKEDNDFLRKLRETRDAGKEKPEEKKVYKKEQNFQTSRQLNFHFRKKILIIFGVLILFAASLTLYILTPAVSVVIKITPISKTASVSAFLKAAETGGDIPLSFIKIKQEKEEKIPARGVVNVLKKASGKIVVYNSISGVSQTLVKSTRFEAEGGKIFVINSAIIVPGMKIVSGKTVPGSVEAVIYATESGDEYNINLSDFTIPGFKGTPKYGKFYARSKTPFTGGYKGVAPKIDEADVKKAEDKLKKELEQEAVNKIESGADKNSVLLKDGLITNFSSETASYKDDAKFAVVRETAEISVPVLKKDDIFKYLAKKYLNNNELFYYIKNFESLNLKMIKNTSANVSSGRRDVASEQTEIKEITIKIEGNAVFLSRVDEEKLKSELVLGEDATKVFKAHSEIENAKIIFRPFLKRILPKNPAKIEIVLEE